ncbi:hypothetical protein [Mycoplasmopsis adleri]|uniref:hypothetical protein n=1 Tax=Mycoplasmopsis adleri TaxID=51362 RepID=UPI003872C3B5
MKNKKNKILSLSIAITPFLVSTVLVSSCKFTGDKDKQPIVNPDEPGKDKGTTPVVPVTPEDPSKDKGTTPVNPVTPEDPDKDKDKTPATPEDPDKDKEPEKPITPVGKEYDREIKIDTNGYYINPSLFKVTADETEPANFNFGNVPLIKKKSNLITKEDLIDMFNYIIGNEIISIYSFGSRQISSNLMASTYSEWIQKNWVNFPYFSLLNGTFTFVLKDNKANVEQMTPARYAFPWNSIDKYQESFNNFIKGGLSKIQEGMQDYEKAYALWLYTLEYFKYDLKKLQSNYERDIYDQSTVCAGYATAYGYMLNLVGINALVNYTGTTPGSDDLHEVVYVKLQLPGTTKPLWYLSDATWGDKEGQTTPIDDSSTSFSKQINYKQFLQPIGKDLHTPIDPVQFSLGEFWGMPWGAFNSGDFAYGDSPTIDFDNKALYKLFDGSTPNIKQVSRFEYYNKEWYGFVKNGNYRAFVKTPFYNTNSFNSNWVIPLNSLINDAALVQRIEKSFNPMLARVNDNFIFYAQDINSSNGQLVVLNMKTKEKKIISITANSKVARIFVKNNQIYYADISAGYDKTYPVKLTKEEYDFVFNNINYNKTYLTKTTLYYANAINLFTVGENVGQISYKVKKEFLDYLLGIEKLNLTSPLDIENKVKEIASKFNEIYLNITKTNKKLLWTSQLPTKVYCNPQYGYNFEGIRAFVNYKDVINPNENMRYDILYSKDNTGFELVAQNVEFQDLMIDKSNTKGSGYYKLKAYLVNHSDNFIETNSSYISFDSNNSLLPIQSGVKDQNLQNININPSTKILILNDINLSATVQANPGETATVELYFIDQKTYKTKVLEKTEVHFDNKPHTVNHHINKVNNTNAGLYYVKRQPKIMYII